MHAALAHVLMLGFAATMARFGWFMVHNPERACRIFLFGQEPAFGKRFAIAWSRTAGWMFMAGGCFGTVLYLVLIPIDLFHSR